MKNLHKWLIIAVLVGLILLSANYIVPDIETPVHLEDEDYFRGKVINLRETETSNGYFQEAEVEITSGPYREDIIEIENEFEEGNRFLDIRLEEDLNIILVSYEQGNEREIYLQDIARDRSLGGAIILLIIALLIVGKFKGLETLISLIISGYIIIQIMIPLMIAGYPPIPIATFSALLIISIILIIIGGLNFKTLAASIGTGVGVIIAGVIAYLIGSHAHLSGLATQEAQMLAAGMDGIDFRGLLFAGIIISSLGATTDVGMSIASSSYQIKKANPNISFKQLFTQSLEVGRDIMGTMSNTLILAYAGGSIPFLMLLLVNHMSWLRIINMNYVSTEILSGISGTLGLVISIPITAFTSSLFLSRD